MWSSNFMSRYSPEEGKSTILKMYMHFSVHCSINYNTEDLEVTLILRDGWRDKKEVVYMHNGVLAIKRVILPFVTRWMGVDNSMLSEKSSVQSLSSVLLSVTPWTAAHQASLSITNSQSLLKLMSIDSVVPSNHLIFCHPLLLLPSIFPNIRVYSNGSALRIRLPKYWSFSFNISPSNKHSGLISFMMDGLDFLGVQGTLKSLPNTTVQKYRLFCSQLSL